MGTRFEPRGPGAAAGYAVLAVALASAPAWVPTYYLSQLVLVGIYVIAGAGLMLLSGTCGQVSLGHSAFLAVGAFAAAVLEKHGVPFPAAFLAAGLLSALAGIAIGIPALRLSGTTFAIATLAASLVVTEAIVRWESVTNGASGLVVPAIRLPGIGGEQALYLLVLPIAAAAVFVARNISAAPLGRAMKAIRDSETAAASQGVPVPRVKLTAFVLSAFAAGIAGALYAHEIRFIDPDQFGVGASLELLVMTFVGGFGSIPGIVLGAAFVIALPQLAAAAAGLIGAAAAPAGLQAVLYGGVLLAFILFEPAGLYGIWCRITRGPAPALRRKRGRSGRFVSAETW
jgi:branched-chain amino acid transport system permease protein